MENADSFVTLNPLSTSETNICGFRNVACNTSFESLDRATNLTSEKLDIDKPKPFYSRPRFLCPVATMLLIVVLVAMSLVLTMPVSWTPEWRLPDKLFPSLYTIEIKVDFVAKEYTGVVDITTECMASTKTVVLNTHKQNLDHARVNITELNSTEPIPVLYTAVYKEFDSYVIFLAKELKLGNRYQIIIENFQAPLIEYDDHNLPSWMGSGLFRTSYRPMDPPMSMEVENKTLSTMQNETSHAIENNTDDDNRYLAASFLSPVAARRVFPCFDEPSFKANFSVTIVHQSEYFALSNMPEIPNGREDRGEGWIATTFETTPTMSTYLLAFIVCDFESENTLSNEGRVEFRVWARQGAMDQVQYAMDIGPKMFTYLESYAAIPYSLPKMDMIALPYLLPYGMENWGLNTFRENILLYKEGVSSSRDQQMSALVIGHELSHQWHSNLVTQAWWDELWLKESFATFMGRLAVDHVHPDFYMTDQQFLTDDLHEVFITDSLSSSHPVYEEVTSTMEIIGNFDMIAYKKGPALVKMMFCLLGEESFKKGLFKYLNDNAYGSATSRDLWEAMDWAAKQDGLAVDIPQIMDTWILQMGYPLVTVTRDYDRESAVISQKHFLMDEHSNYTIRESPFGYIWRVPITYTTATEPNFTNPHSLLLTEERETLNLTGSSRNEWVVFNVNQEYFYRVNYDPTNWDLIINQLNTDHTVLTPSQKAALIDDAFNLAKAGKLDPTTGLRLTQYLKKETEYLPWCAALKALNHLDRLLSHTAAYGVFKQYMLQQVQELYDQVGWEDKGPQLEKFHRVEILIAACRYGHPVCTQEAMKLYRDWIDNGKEIAINLKKAVVCGGIAIGGVEEWDFAFAKYNESNVAAERSMLLDALTCSRELWILSRYLDMTLNDEFDELTALQVYTTLAQTSLGSYIMWDFFREHWELIVSRYEGGMHQMTPLVDAVTSTFATKVKMRELQHFYESNVQNVGSDAPKGAFLGALDKTKANVKWLDENLSIVQAWLETAVE